MLSMLSYEYATTYFQLLTVVPFFFPLPKNIAIKIFMQKSWCSSIIILLGLIPKGKITG